MTAARRDDGRTTGLVRSLATVLAVVGGLLTCLPPAPATAAPGSAEPLESVESAGRECRVPDCHGAISFNTRTGEAGIAVDRRSRREAVRLAHDKCRARSERGHGFPGQCERAGSTSNGCMAVAFRVDSSNTAIVAWETRYGAQPARTRRKARRAVAGPGEVYVGAWLCTSRS